MPNFNERSTKLERIDTGDYTPDEYQRFLHEIAFINKYLGDRRALKNSFFHDINRNLQKPPLQKPARSKGVAASKNTDQPENPIFSLLDIGSGSGELLRFTAEFARKTGRTAQLVGLDLNPISAATTASKKYPEITSVRGDAFHLPFADDSFDYAIASLFFHHLTDEQIPHALTEMSRVASRGIYVIDLHRHSMAYSLYQLFCFAFRISPLVLEDGSLSILKGFKREELLKFAQDLDLPNAAVSLSAPYRLILTAGR